jgi:two-component system invasion response regulator UvrY
LIRVFLVDDHDVVREGLQRIIETTDDMRVVGQTGDPDEAVARAANESWDVVLLDLSLGDASGLDTLKRLKELRPRMPILILTMQPEDQRALRVLHAGAAGYLTKGRSSREVLEAIRRVVAGGRWVSERVAELLLANATDLAKPAHDSLSDRELEILMKLARGSTPGEIAATLDLSASTVSTHLNHIRQKLGVRSNPQLVEYAVREKLIP